MKNNMECNVCHIFAQIIIGHPYLITPHGVKNDILVSPCTHKSINYYSYEYQLIPILVTID